MTNNILSISEYNKICRTCLKTNDCLMSLFKTEIFNMLSVCTTININENDGFPNQICTICYQRVTDAYNFRKQCENSDQTLRKSYNEQCKESELKENVKINITNEEHVDENSYDNEIDEYMDEDSSTVNDSKDDEYTLQEIKNHEHKSESAWERALQLGADKCDPTTKTCKICNKVLYNVHSLVRHVETHDENRKFAIVCPICNKGFYEKQHMTNHMLRHKGEARYQCNECTKPFYELFAMRLHYKRKHSYKKVSCNECDKKFFLQQDLEMHQKTHNKQQHQCPDCGKTFRFRFRMKDHQWMHAKERIFHCRQCDKSFKSNQVLQLHYKRVHSDERKREICNICGKSVVYLKTHLNIHNNEKFNCNECNREFRNKYSLDKHRKRKHGNMDDATLNPYLCNICGKRSENLRMLNRHLLTHTDVRPHKCPVCGKHFKTAYRRNNHVKHTHNNVRDYKCTYCSKCFHTKSGLTIHIRVHTGERPYSCKLCGKAFQQRSTLRTHMKVHGLHTKNDVDEISRNIQITADDGLPHQICSTCFTKTVDSFSYRQQCEHSDQFLRQLLIKNEGKFQSNEDEIKIITEDMISVKLETNDIKNDDNQDLDNLDDTTTSSEDDDKSSIKNANDFVLNASNQDALLNRDTARVKALNMWGLDKCDPDTSTCKICNKVLVNTNSLVRHMEIHNENRKFNVICKICNKGFYETGHLTKHMLRHKGEARYKCEKCPKMFYELSALGIHLKRRHKVKPSTCTECDKSFLVPLQLENHMRAAHGEQKKFVCSECGKAYHQESLLRKHQTAHTNERLFHCLQCDKSYKDKPNLAKHIKRAHLSETKREVCTICGKSIINLRKHLAYVHGDEHVKCTECSKEFTSTFCLNDHIKKKHRKSDVPRKKPYLCSDCGYTCEGKSSLKTHYEQKHTQIRAYKCTICSKCFKTRGELTKHIRYTHNYDPQTSNAHACGQCSKSFKTKSALQYHVRYTHSDEKQFMCTGCTKQFKTKGTLKIHMRTHTGERPFECKYCGKTFGQGSTLKTHMKVHGATLNDGTNVNVHRTCDTNDTTTSGPSIQPINMDVPSTVVPPIRVVTSSVVTTESTSDKHTTPDDDEHVEKYLISL